MNKLEDKKIQAEINMLEAQKIHFLAQAKQFEAEEQKLKLEAAKSDLEVKLVKVEVQAELAKRVRGRKVDFFGLFDAEKAEWAVHKLSQLAELNNEPITFRISSDGGQVEAGLIVYDAIKGLVNSGVEVTTLASGQIASMAVIAFQAGSRRVITPNSYLGLHSIAYQTEQAEVKKQKDRVKWAERMQARLVDILMSRSKLTKEKLEAGIAKQEFWWIDAKEAKKVGLADAVGYA